MEDLAARLRQCKKPSGDEGRRIADEMNESHYMLTGWGLEYGEVPAGGEFLDIGCGGGRTLYRLAEAVPEGIFYGVDYSMDCVNWSKEYNKKWIDQRRMEVRHGSVEALPFSENRFDFITAVETVYFWPDLIGNFREVYRVLRPGGQFVIILAAYENPAFAGTNQVFTQSGDMKIFAPEELTEALERAGFSKVDVHTRPEKNWICCVNRK